MKKFVCGFVVVAVVLVVFACASGSGARGEQGLAGGNADIEVFPQLGHTSFILFVAFSPDGRQILSGSTDNTIRLWDAVTDRELRTFAGHTDYVYSVVFSPDGRQVLSGSGDRTIKLWDVATGQEIKTFSGHSSWVYSVAFSPDGRQVISGSGDRTIKLWDMVTGQIIRTFEGHTSSVTSVAFSPDSRQVLSGSSDRTIKLWDAATGREIRTFSGHGNGMPLLGQNLGQGIRINFSPDGKYILSGSDDGTIKLWDVATGQEIRTLLGHSHWVYSVVFNSDGRQVLSGSLDGTIRLWDTLTGREIKTFAGHTSIVTTVAFSPDGSQVLSGSGDRTIKLWDTLTGREIKTLSGHSNYVYSVAFSPDGRQVLSNSGDRTIKLWDTLTGREIRTFVGHTNYVFSVAFSPDGRQILSGSGDRTVKLWDTLTGREIREFSDGRNWIRSVTFSPDGKQILFGFNATSIKLWDMVANREIRTLSGHSGWVFSVAFSPDGRQILSGSADGTVRLWDATTGRVIITLAENGQVFSVAFSPNGRQILSGSSGRIVRLWDAATGEDRSFVGHTSSVNSVAFSPDGRQILSGSDDRTVRLWDVAKGEEIRSFVGHTSSVNSVAFSPNGKQILSGSSDGTVRLWDIATGKEIASFISFSGADSQLAGGSRDFTVEVETAATSIDGEWVVITPDGYYQASPRGDRYLNVRYGNTVTGIDSFRSVFYNPDVVRARLAGETDPPSKATVTIQQAAAFMPPEISLQSETRTATSSTANISVSITDRNIPIQSIIVMVNGRRLGANELAAVSGASGLQPNRASLSVTGNQKALNLTLPVKLDPGDNRVEVVAFNGYAENRRFVDVVWDAPSGTRPTLPDLWILAIGVNRYDNAGAGLGNLRNLNYCVADARGVIDSLKAQEGTRYAKVHSLLVADDAEVQPTAANIRRSLAFLEGAGPRDVVLLFLAGHGVSAQESKFFFLPRDAVISTARIVDPSRAISGDEIVSVLDAPGNRLVFIDACQSGGVDNDRMIRSLMDTNAFVFAASRGNESSYEMPDLRHGVFTYSILTALGGEPSALVRGNVSVLSMSGYVKNDVPRRTGGRQNPSAYSLGFYDFPITVIR